MITVGSVVTIRSDLPEALKKTLKSANFPPAGVPAIVVRTFQTIHVGQLLLTVEFEGDIGTRQLYSKSVELYKSEILT